MPSKKSFLKQLISRYDQESPDFFKRFYRFGRVMLAGAGSIIAAELVVPGVKIPELLITIAGYVAVAGASIMTVSKAANKKEDDDTPAEKQNEHE